jgi:hypothetical protein
MICGFFNLQLKVELAHGGRGNSSSDRYSSYSGSGSSRAAPKHSDYRGMCCLQYDSFSYTKLQSCAVLILSGSIMQF